MTRHTVRLVATLLTKPMTVRELVAASGHGTSCVEAFVREAHKQGLIYQAGLRCQPMDAEGRKAPGRKASVWCVQPLPFFHRDYNHTL